MRDDRRCRAKLFTKTNTLFFNNADEQSRRKRGRPPKTPRTSANRLSGSSIPLSQQPRPTQQQQQPMTLQLQSQGIPHQSHATPSQTSPPAKTTPTKPIVKALPTVRDHTTDQLGKEGDEYIPKEFDESGEKKVDAMGYPQDGRVYKCRTFRVPNRGEKLFMLATECARVLGYRDSYLLFNKNRSLFKIIATQTEKDDLIQQDILPYSYRSRQIAIVTAKSMFRQFGSRVIVNGRRVRDDYWESKARKQGFTEEDMAGEKRPGAAKARDTAAAEAATAGIMPTLGHGDVIYSNGPHVEGIPQTQGLPPGLGPQANLPPLPMIHLAPTDDPRMREFSNIPRPRQDIAGQPYQDRSQPSNAAEILNQASHTAEFNKILNQQRGYRSKGMDEFWNKTRDAPASTPQAQAPGQTDTLTAAASSSQPMQSPQLGSTGMLNPNQQQNVMAHHTQMMTPQTYSPQQHQPDPSMQSPVRRMSQSIRPDQMQHRPSNLSLSSTGSAQNPAYGYPSQHQQLWGQPPPQPQPSPLSHQVGIPQYTPQMHPQQSSSPHPHQQQQPHPSQSPRRQSRPHQQVPQSQQINAQSQAQQQQQNLASLGYPGGTAAGYPNLGAARGMYTATQSPGQQQYMAGSHPQAGVSMGMGGAAGLPGWPSTTGGPLPPAQPQPGQSQGPLGGWSGY